MKYKQSINCKKKKIRPFQDSNYPRMERRICKQCKEGYASKGKKEEAKALNAHDH